jgi:hypothetical protein
MALLEYLYPPTCFAVSCFASRFFSFLINESSNRCIFIVWFGCVAKTSDMMRLCLGNSTTRAGTTWASDNLEATIELSD